jgi:hypothetical protein
VNKLRPTPRRSRSVRPDHGGRVAFQLYHLPCPVFSEGGCSYDHCPELAMTIFRHFPSRLLVFYRLYQRLLARQAKRGCSPRESHMTLGEVAQLKRVAPETEVRRVAVARGGAQFKGDECVSLAPTMPAREPGVRLLENGGVIWIDLGDDTSRPEILKLSESVRQEFKCFQYDSVTPTKMGPGPPRWCRGSGLPLPRQ